MKKLIIFALSVVMAVGLCLPAFATGEIVPETPAFNASLNIDSVSSNGNVSAGSTFYAYFSINAPGHMGGTAIATVSEAAGFTIDGYRANYTVSGTIEASRSYAVPIFVESATPTGRYQVVLTVYYTDTNGDTVKCSTTMNINVSGVGEAPELPETQSAVTLNITSAPTSPVIAGNTFNVGFTAYLNNYGYYYGYGYSSGIVSVEGTGFTLAGALAEQSITSGTNNISILVDPSTPTGRQQVTVIVKFTDSEGKEVTASKALNIDVIGDNESEIIDESKDVASFELTGASIPEGKGRSELSTKLKISVKNTTGFVAKNVKVRLSELNDIILTTYTDTLSAGDVNPDQTVNATFPIKFPELTKPQHRVVAEVTFDGPNGAVTQNFNIYLQAVEKKQDETAPESAALTPKVIVSNYSTDVEKILSGEEFTLTFVLQNTSNEKDLRNMTVNVTPQSSQNGTTTSGPVFSFIDGTSSFYTPLLEKSSEIEYSIRMKCSASAGAGSYPIQISFNFEYSDNGGYSSGNGEMSLNMPVEQPIKFELIDWVPPTESGLDGVPISFQYFNKSRNAMTALTITCEGDFEMPQQFVGTLNASNMDVFSGTITPVEGAQVGDTKTAVLVFTFEDAAGSEQRIEEKFDVKIVEGSIGGDMMGGDMMGGDMMGGDFTFDYGGEIGPDGMPVDGENTEEAGGLPLWAKIVIPAAIAVVVIIVIAVVVKKVKAKRDAEDDEE